MGAWALGVGTGGMESGPVVVCGADREIVHGRLVWRRR